MKQFGNYSQLGHHQPGFENNQMSRSMQQPGLWGGQDNMYNPNPQRPFTNQNGINNMIGGLGASSQPQNRNSLNPNQYNVGLINKPDNQHFGFNPNKTSPQFQNQNNMHINPANHYGAASTNPQNKFPDFNQGYAQNLHPQLSEPRQYNTSRPLTSGFNNERQSLNRSNLSARLINQDGLRNDPLKPLNNFYNRATLNDQSSSQFQDYNPKSFSPSRQSSAIDPRNNTRVGPRLSSPTNGYNQEIQQPSRNIGNLRNLNQLYSQGYGGNYGSPRSIPESKSAVGTAATSSMVNNRSQFNQNQTYQNSRIENQNIYNQRYTLPGNQAAYDETESDYTGDEEYSDSDEYTESEDDNMSVFSRRGDRTAGVYTNAYGNKREGFNSPSRYSHKYRDVSPINQNKKSSIDTTNQVSKIFGSQSTIRSKYTSYAPGTKLQAGNSYYERIYLGDNCGVGLRGWQEFFNHSKQEWETVMKVKRLITGKQFRGNTVNLPGVTRGTTLLVDMDETLIHSEEWKAGAKYDEVVDIVNPMGKIEKIGVYVRPYCLEFLQRISQKFEVVVFTAAREDYASKVISKLDPTGKMISGSLFRQHCSNADGSLVKDFRVIGNRRPENIILIDNLIYSFAADLDNGIHIKSYVNGNDDYELEYLANVLDKLAPGESIPKFIDTNFKFKQFYQSLR